MITLACKGCNSKRASWELQVQPSLWVAYAEREKEKLIRERRRRNVGQKQNEESQ